MSFMKEFKDFAIKGNMVDMAVGIIIGAAFGKIVASLVKDVVMPYIGTLMGGVDFTTIGHTLVAKTADADAIIAKWGVFIQSIVDFLVVAIAVFVAVKVINGMKKKEEEAPSAPPKPTADQELLTEIRDLLKK